MNSEQGIPVTVANMREWASEAGRAINNIIPNGYRAGFIVILVADGQPSWVAHDINIHSDQVPRMVLDAMNHFDPESLEKYENLSDAPGSGKTGREL